jgi:hypothetical protein
MNMSIRTRYLFLDELVRDTHPRFVPGSASPSQHWLSLVILFNLVPV